MSDFPLLSWGFVLAALVIGILAGHFGWGRRWPASLSKLHPDYLTGLDYLVTEQPDRALDMFLKLMDANAETIETHFALGVAVSPARRGRARHPHPPESIWLARISPRNIANRRCWRWRRIICAPAFWTGRKACFSRSARCRGCARARSTRLRGVYERQHDWQQALGTYRQLARIKAAPARSVAAHYLCELASVSIERGDIESARHWLRDAQDEAAPFPRAAL